MGRETFFYIFHGILLVSICDTRGNNLTFFGKSGNLSSRYEEHSYRRDRYSPGDGLLSPQDGKGSYCKYPARCQHLNYTTCMGLKLPYTSTTLDLVADSRTQEQIQENIQQWLALHHIPKCWSVVQPFLCSLYMPKCEEGMVDLPSQEMCRMTMGPCRILHLEHYWPSFFRCDDQEKFPPMCKNDVRELKFNTTGGQCLTPLVPTENVHAFYDGVEGCGVQCENPMLTEDEHRQIHQLVAWGGTVCLFFNLFTVVTFFIDWRSANKYPALVIFYINCCFLVSCIGWLAQFIPGAREGIVCRKDGTLRMSEPSAGENLSCVIVFVLVYYFIMAALVWFVILTYTWHISFQALGKIQDRIDKKSAYFHMVAWSLPLILTITTMALGEIDGDSVAGICFVGYINHAARAGFLLGPIATVLLVGGYFLSRGLITLVRLKISSQQIISERASAKIRETIVRMGLFSLFTFVFVLVTFVCHMYEFQHHNRWKESFRKFITCQIMNSARTVPSKCRMEHRPSLAMLQLHLLVMFLAGVVMSSWVWTNSTVDTWRRCIRRTLNSQVEEPVRLKKHKVIAQAFAKRKMFNNAGRLSISFHSTHEDPVGLNIDVNSVASQDFSSTWAAALPKLMTRRGALIGVATGSNSSQPRNSLDSEISYSVRRVSVESRRHSLDSQVSVQIAEVTATRKAATTPMPTTAAASSGTGGRGRKTRPRRHRREFGRVRSSKVGPIFVRRGSTTSQESQIGAQILSALTLANTNIPTFVPNLKKRRTANAGLDSSKVILPFTLPGQSTDLSDEQTPGPGEVQDDASEASGVENEVPLDLSKHSRCAEESRQDSGIEASRSGEVEGCRNRTTESNKVKLEFRNMPDDLKVYLTEDSEEELPKKMNYLPSVDLVGISDGSTSFCPELSQLAVHSSHSGASVGAGKVSRISVAPRAVSREIGTQTSQSDYVEMQNFKAPSAHSSHVSSVLPQKQLDKSDVNKLINNVSSSSASRALNYSYNAQQLMQELNVPVRPERRKSKDSARSKSADVAHFNTALC